jgi:class 3 adenylate cyclase
MPSKHLPMKLSREEETFLRHWMYDEAHDADEPGPAERLQVEHGAKPADLTLLISAALPDPADQEAAALGPAPAEAPTWPWSDDALRARIAEARAALAEQPRARAGKKRRHTAKTGDNPAPKEQMHHHPPKDTPPGFRLLRTLEGHGGAVCGVAWSPDGRLVATGSLDGPVHVWDAGSGEETRRLEGHHRLVYGVAWSPDGRLLATGGGDRTVRLWDTSSGKEIRKLEGHGLTVFGVAWSPDGRLLGTGDSEGTVRVWEAGSGKEVYRRRRHNGPVYGVAWSLDSQLLATGSDTGIARVWGAGSGNELLVLTVASNGGIGALGWSPDSQLLATPSADRTVGIWEARTGKLVASLEGHTSQVDCARFSPDGRLMATISSDRTARFWGAYTWMQVGVLPLGWDADASPGPQILAWHPDGTCLAVVDGPKMTAVTLWQLDPALLLAVTVATPTAHYVNAKVVLVGDSGVGKSGLGLVLTGQPFAPTESTHGRHVWTFDSRAVELDGARRQTREVLLWDLAGQPTYRVIHQLHLNEVAVALVVFDARSETDPLAGVRHWERALRLARQREAAQAVPMCRFLVVARADRGSVSVSRARIDGLMREFDFHGFFETSAKEGWQIPELRAAIEKAIPWNDLPIVVSSELFASIKAFLLEVKETGRLLATASDLFADFARRHPQAAKGNPDLRAQFETCVGRLENRDLIRRLSFGGYVLLQPELLDGYASALVNAAKAEPDGFGSLAEEAALAGHFAMPKDERVADRAQEQLLLHATVEELVRHDLALRETATDGRYLVFPSQFNRDFEDAPDPKGKALAFTFEGPVQSVYATLAVRLAHSGLFEIGRAEMWRNAAVYSARVGGKCGLFLREFAEARGELTLFFDPQASEETRFQFEEYARAHLERRVLEGTLATVRSFVCPGCATTVPEVYAEGRRERGLDDIECGKCGARVSLAHPKERLTREYVSQVAAMDASADRERDLSAGLLAAAAETRTDSFLKWAGGPHVTLAIVFTDVVGSTALGEELGDEPMGAVRNAHFEQGAKLLQRHQGRLIKTIGDSIMAAFKSAAGALDFALALCARTGHDRIKVRAGIHVGPVQVEGEDAFGGTVNFAARVVGAIKGAEIWLSEDARRDIDRLRARQHKDLQWSRHSDVEMKGFAGKFTLWQLAKPVPVGK